MDDTPRRLAEIYVYRHAQVVVHGVVGTVDIAGQSAGCVQAVEYLRAGVEGEEVADAVWIGAAVGPGGCRRVVEDKFARACAVRLELGKVLPHVVIIIALVVQLEQTGYVCVTGFAVVPQFGIEEILQGFDGVGVRNALAAVFPEVDQRFAQILNAGSFVGVPVGGSAQGSLLGSAQLVIPDKGVVPVRCQFPSGRRQVQFGVPAAQNLFYDTLHASVCISV